MNTKQLMPLAVVALLAIAMGSCKQDLPYNLDSNEEYTRNFIKTFGLIDPNQDWNLAQAAEVSVNVGEHANSVKVYCKVNAEYYLVADLKNVSGSFKVPVDIPQGSKDLMVKIDGMKYYTTIGGSVSKIGSRSIMESSGDVMISWTDPIVFNVMQVSPILTDGRWLDYVNGEGELRINTFADSDPLSQGLIPEGNNGSGLANYANPYVVKDFYFYGVDEGKTGSDRKGVTIYPMYWQTSSSHVVGMYYFVKDGQYVKPGTDGATMVTVDLFKDKNADETTGDEQLRVSTSNLTTLQGCYKIDKSQTTLNIIYAANPGKTLDQLYKKVDDEIVKGEMWSSTYSMLTEEACLNIVNYLKHNYTGAFESSGKTYDQLFNCFAQAWDDGSGVDLWFNFTVFDSAANGHQAFTPNQNVAVSAKGINIKVPTEMYFGLYIRLVGDSSFGNFYSQSEFNTSDYHEDFATWATDAALESPVVSGKSFAATYLHQSSGRQFFSFEDACDNVNDWDLNDIVFRMDGAYKTATTDESVTLSWVKNETNRSDRALTWLIAAEDLGATDDFDFNDVIFQVQSVTTNYDSTTSTESSDGDSSSESSSTISKRVVVQALAAGGMLPVYLHFDTESDKYLLGPNNIIMRYEGGNWVPVTDDSKSADDCEWHKWFGDYSRSTMINTGGVTVPNPLSCDISSCVDLSSFTMADYSKTTDGNKTIQGFYITVGDNLPSSDMSADIGDNKTVIQGDNKGAAPQMFLIPDLGPVQDTDGNNIGWCWPTERQHILSAYSSFGDWVGSANMTDWHKSGAGIRPAKGLSSYSTSSSSSSTTQTR